MFKDVQVRGTVAGVLVGARRGSGMCGSKGKRRRQEALKEERRMRTECHPTNSGKNDCAASKSSLGTIFRPAEVPSPLNSVALPDASIEL